MLTLFPKIKSRYKSLYGELWLKYKSLYGGLWLKYKSLYGNEEMTFKSFNVWYIYQINTLEHSMLSFFVLFTLITLQGNENKSFSY